MPRLDGLQSTSLIRKLGYSAPIVAITASAEKDIVSMGIDSGMDKVIRFGDPNDPCGFINFTSHIIS